MPLQTTRAATAWQPRSSYCPTLGSMREHLLIGKPVPGLARLPGALDVPEKFAYKRLMAAPYSMDSTGERVEPTFLGVPSPLVCRIKAAIRAVPPVPPYYPGIQQRFDAFVQHNPGAEIIHSSRQNGMCVFLCPPHFCALRFLLKSPTGFCDAANPMRSTTFCIGAVFHRESALVALIRL